MKNDLIVKVAGSITQSNFPEYRDKLLAQIGGIKTELVTDQDFSEAEKTVKVCKAAEDKIALAKGYAMEEAADINDLFCAMDEVSGKLRETRLALNRQIKKEKESRKTTIIKSGSDAVNEFMSCQHAAVKQMVINHQVFTDVAKGKRNLKSMQDSVDNAAAELIADIQRTAELVENNLAVFESVSAGHSSLFPDKNVLLVTSESELVATAEGRIAKADLEARNRTEREEREKKTREDAASSDKKSMDEEEKVTELYKAPEKLADQVADKHAQPTEEQERYVMAIIINGTKEQAKEVATVAYNAIQVNHDSLVESVNLDPCLPNKDNP